MPIHTGSERKKKNIIRGKKGKIQKAKPKARKHKKKKGK